MACNGEEVLETGFESVRRRHYVWCKIGFGSDELTVIIILALVALFIGLRLYSVLGERTGHEQQPILKPADPDAARVERAPMPASPVAQPAPDAIGDLFLSWRERSDRSALRHPSAWQLVAF